MKSWFLALIVLIASPFAAAQDLDQLLARAQSSSGLWAHLDGAVLMKGNQPVCAFGVRQIGEEKPQYTYFVLFRRLPKSDAEWSVTGPLRSKGYNTDYTVVMTVGKKQVEISHKMEMDKTTKKLTTDDLRVAGEAIKPGTSRVFVIDLSADTPSMKQLDIKPPATVLDPHTDSGHLEAIKKITTEYVAASKELQELLKAP
jgi:hypothetical protein